MTIIRLTFLVLFISITGCATIKSDYTPLPAKVANENTVPPVDISFSVEIVSEIGSFSVIDQEDLVPKIKEQLRETGLFKKIVYAPFSKRQDKHLHFQLVVSGTKEDEAQAFGMLSGLTLMMIPISIDYYSDMSIFIIESNNEIFSAAASEKINQILWLPFIVVSPFFNDYVTGHRVVNSQIAYLVSEISANNIFSSSN